MKRIILMITAVVLLLSLVGCEIRLPGIDISINNSNNSPKPVGTVAPNATDAMPTVAPTIATHSSGGGAFSIRVYAEQTCNPRSVLPQLYRGKL